MKLRTKLTAMCAVLLLITAVSLSGAMLWQVREQSYQNLTQRSEERLSELIDAFSEAVIRNASAAERPAARKAVLKYCFQSCGAEGSVLAVTGELLSAPTRICHCLYEVADLMPIH